MATILILYASHFGQTRAIARGLAEELRRAHLDVEIVDAKQQDPPAPGDFDAIVLGSRVEMGRHAPEIRDYIANHRETLREIPTAFFSVSMAASSPNAGDDPSGYLALEDLDWKPTLSIAFAGALRYRKYNWPLRFVRKLTSRSAGHPTDTRDHDLTDWPRVRQFARDITALVKPTREVATRF